MMTAIEASSHSRRYKAPALEKGLDILEFITGQTSPTTISMMSQIMGKSISELFRMIQVLEYRGFIKQAGTGEGYIATDHLFSLAMQQAPVKNILELSLPVMRDLSSEIGQSCHLVVRSGGDIVVIARMESAQSINFTVRVGSQQALAETASGIVLFAYQQESVREQWLTQISSNGSTSCLNNLTLMADQVRERGYEKMKSTSITGLTEISAPILRGASAAAALVVPFVHFVHLNVDLDQAVKYLRAAAAQISASLLMVDNQI